MRKILHCGRSAALCRSSCIRCTGANAGADHTSRSRRHGRPADAASWSATTGENRHGPGTRAAYHRRHRHAGAARSGADLRTGHHAKNRGDRCERAIRVPRSAGWTLQHQRDKARLRHHELRADASLRTGQVDRPHRGAGARQGKHHDAARISDLGTDRRRVRRAGGGRAGECAAVRLGQWPAAAAAGRSDWRRRTISGNTGSTAWRRASITSAPLCVAGAR